MVALMWISHSELPLMADNHCYSLAIVIASPNFDTDNVPSVSLPLTSCHGIVAIENEASVIGKICI